jgi:hypothetical protein
MGSSRDWTNEEKMAYLDWSKAEEDRVEAQLATEMAAERAAERAGNRLPRRGMHEIWEAAIEDEEAQRAFYSGR